MTNYPEGLLPWHFCHMEGCVGNGHCPRCGKTNYHLLGYYGAVARWAKAWGVTPKEAEARFYSDTVKEHEIHD